MTTETKFTAQQLSDWWRYEKVRQSCRYNMIFPQAREATGLSRERYLFCRNHYSELKEAVEGDHAPTAIQGDTQ